MANLALCRGEQRQVAQFDYLIATIESVPAFLCGKQPSHFSWPATTHADDMSFSGAAKEYHCSREGGSTPDYPLHGAGDRPRRLMARDREKEIDLHRVMVVII